MNKNRISTDCKTLCINAFTEFGGHRFIIVAFVLVVIATVMKEAGAGAVLSIAGVAIFILYQAMFKKSKPEKNNEDNDITLKK